MEPILIKTLSGSDRANEDFAIIELQGDLQSHSNTPLAGKFIGDLHFSKDGTPILIIGHHLLHGKEVTLEKPFALLKKQRDASSNVTFEVKCIIRRKLVFKTRPKPIVTL